MENSLKYIPINTAERIKDLFKSLSKDYLKLVFEKENEICSFGVFTDSDIHGLNFGYNTKKGWDDMIKSGKEYKEKNPDSKTPIDHSKWWIPNWRNKIDDSVFHHDSRQNELFDIFNDSIESITSTDDYCENDDFSNYKDDIFDLICQSLKELKDENSFLRISNNFYLLVQEGDNGIYGNRTKSLSKILSKQDLDEYIIYDKNQWCW